MLTLSLLVAALVLFLLAAFWTPGPPKVNLVAAGLACLTLAMLVRFGPGLA